MKRKFGWFSIFLFPLFFVFTLLSELKNLSIAKRFIWAVFRFVLITVLITAGVFYWIQIQKDPLFAIKIINPQISQTAYKFQNRPIVELKYIFKSLLNDNYKVDLAFRTVAQYLKNYKTTDKRLKKALVSKAQSIEEISLEIVTSKDKHSLVLNTQKALKTTAEALEILNKNSDASQNIIEDEIIDISIIADGLNENNYYDSLNKAFEKIIESLEIIEKSNKKH